MTPDSPDSLIQPERLHRLFQRMVDIYSPSGKEIELLDYLYGYLKRQGLPVERQRLEDGRYNIVSMDAEKPIELALIGHVDTVNAFDIEEIGFREEGDTIRGLGTADMKGGCAALMEAFLASRQAGRADSSIALMLVVGEEENGDGTARLMEDLHFPWALIAEPTMLAPCFEHYGYIEIQLTTRGRRRHASLVERNANPVENLLTSLLTVTRWLTENRPESVYNIRDLLTSQSGFAVPDWCEAWIDLHIPPHSPTGDFCTEIEEIFEPSPPGSSENVKEIRFHTIQDGYYLPERGRLIQVLRGIFEERGLEWKPTAFQSHSDANLLWANGVKPVLFGPGSLAKAHTPDESVSFQEVLRSARVIADLIQSYSDPTEKLT